MITKLSKWGNSLGVRLPKAILDELRLKDGAEVKVTNDGGRIIIESSDRDMTMTELLEGMTKEKVMDQWQNTKPVGKEKWWSVEDEQ